MIGREAEATTVAVVIVEAAAATTGAVICFKMDFVLRFYDNETMLKGLL